MKTKPKVCLVVSTMLIVRFFLRDIITRLAEKYDVTVIVNMQDAAFVNAGELPARFIHLPIERKVAPRRDVISLVQLAQLFRREKFDLVHSVSPKGGLLAMIAGAVVGIPIRLHTFQGEVWVTRRGFWRVLLKFLDKVVARLATHLLVVSRSEQQFLIEQGVVPVGKSTVLASGSISGVDLDRFKPNADVRRRIREELGIGEGETVFLYLGRLTADKGVLDLAFAFSDLCTQQCDAYLVIVGPDEEGMREQLNAISPECENRIRFVGYTEVPENYISASDIICLPSYREGFGMVIIEAAAAGVPAIASRIYGITDAVVENQTGLLFEAGNVADLCDKMKRLNKDMKLRAEMGEHALTRARQEFSRERVMSATLDYYAGQLCSGDISI